MRDCPYNPGVTAVTCKGCPDRCGFDPHEIARRKRLIDKGNGLTDSSLGLKHLKIKRSE